MRKCFCSNLKLRETLRGFEDGMLCPFVVFCFVFGWWWCCCCYFGHFFGVLPVALVVFAVCVYVCLSVSVCVCVSCFGVCCVLRAQHKQTMRGAAAFKIFSFLLLFVEPAIALTLENGVCLLRYLH